MVTRRAPPILIILAILACGCDKPNEAQGDRWPSTTDGIEKLEKAFSDAKLGVEQRARAGASLVTLGHGPEVVSMFVNGQNSELLVPFAQFLQKDAEVATKMQVPTPSQIAAKDALFDLRDAVSSSQRGEIDAYLAQWLGAYYEGRSALGRHPGEEMAVAIGSHLAQALIVEIETLLKPPQDASAPVPQIGDDLLRGLALSGPLGLAAILDLAQGKVGTGYPDPTLKKRATDALAYAFEGNRQRRQVLVPLVPRLEELAADTHQEPALSNLSFDLIARIGKPICLRPLAALAQHDEEIRVIMALRKGLECAGVDAVIPMAEALRTDRDVDFESMETYFWDAIGKLGKRAAPRARTLLSSGNWLARLTGVKVLERVGDASDVARLRHLAGDKAPLRGKPGKDTKVTATTVGGEARLVADKLEKSK
jgi:hypothetical protein